MWLNDVINVLTVLIGLLSIAIFAHQTAVLVLGQKGGPVQKTGFDFWHLFRHHTDKDLYKLRYITGVSVFGAPNERVLDAILAQKQLRRFHGYMKMWLHHVINVLTVFIGLLTIGYLYTRRQFSFWAKKGVQFRKPHFIFGNFGDITKRKVLSGAVMVDFYNDFKSNGFGGVWEMFTPKLFLADPKLVGDILGQNFSTWPNRGVTLNPDVNPLDEQVLNLDGRRWKLVRAKLTPTFSSAKLKHMHYLLLECGKDFEKYLRSVVTKGEFVDATDMTAKFTTDVTGSCVFGIQMNSLNDRDALFRRMGEKMFEPSSLKQLVPLVQNGFPWLFKFLKLSTMTQELTDFFIKITKETFDYREKNNIQRHDFMDLLRNMKNSGDSLGEDEVEFDDNLLAAQAHGFFLAGFYPTSTTISYCLHELAVNQDVQDRLREEVHRTKAADNGEITWDGLKNMKYMNMVVQETLRKYPIIPRIHRVSVRPYRIPDTNVEVPAGIKAIIPIYALHHDPEYYPDPEKFDPERFTEEAKSKRPAFTYIPFGGGPRNCIGLRFGEQQMKMALVKVVDTFRVSLCEKSQDPLPLNIRGVFLQPAAEIWLKMSRYVSN